MPTREDVINKPPAELQTTEDVRAWIADLRAADLLFHFEDRADDIGNMRDGAWVRTFTDDEAALIEALVERCYEVCGPAGVDVFDLYPPID